MFKKSLVPLVILGLSLSVSGIVLGALASVHLKHNSEKLLKFGITFLDRLILNAEVTAQRAAFYTQKPCVEVLPSLRELVVMSPDVRLINFVKEERIYCSSLEGEVEIPLNERTLSKSLFLRERSPFNPKESSLEFVSENGDVTIISSVSGYYIRQILTSISEDQHILLHIDAQVMDKQKFFKSHLTSPTLAIHSLQYPYSLSIKLTYDDYIQHILEHKLLLVFYFLLLCGALSGASYRLMNKPETLETLLASAIENEEIVPYIQPYVDKNLNMIGIEVLARWLHPTKGLINPDLFIPIAEDSGLIIPMTKSLMNQVQKTLTRYQGCLCENFNISFNISAKHCTQSNLLEDSRDFLTAFSHSKVTLCFELTERELIKDTKEARELFDTLHQHNVQLAIDDFGTGHSSLSYLNQFHFDVLKLDKSFVQMIGTNSVSMHIVQNLLDLALRLEMKTVAEGVETKEQAEYLVAHNVDYLQGYFFYKPVPLDDFVDKLIGESA